MLHKGEVIVAPKGPACMKRFHLKKTYPILEWTEFCRRYKEDPIFRSVVDAAAKQMDEAPKAHLGELVPTTVSSVERSGWRFEAPYIVKTRGEIISQQHVTPEDCGLLPSAEKKWMPGASLITSLFVTIQLFAS